MKKFKTKSKVMLPLLLIALLVITSTTCLKAFYDDKKILDIIEITDFHGSLEDVSANQVAQVLAKNIDEVKKLNPSGTVIVSGGDNYQGSALSNILKGEPVVKFFNALGVEVSCLGNHEFDWGLDAVLSMKHANYETICSNLYSKLSGERPFKPYKIMEKDGIKIAIVAAISQDTPKIVLAENIKDFEVKDPAEEINKAVDEAKNEGAQVVLALVHSGMDKDGKTGELLDISKKLTGVDAVLGGHTHNVVYEKLENGKPLVVAGNNGKGFMDLTISVDTNSFEKLIDVKYYDISGTNYSSQPAEPKPIKAEVPWLLNGWFGYKESSSDKVADPIFEAVYQIVKEAKEKVGPTLEQKLGTATEKITRNQKKTPYGSSELGNWVADVIKNSAGADFGFQNNGGIRIDIPKGDITVGTMYSLMPFDNTVVTLNMRGEQVYSILEKAVADGGVGIQVSGLKFSYDPDMPSGSRIVRVEKDDGSPVEAKTVYHVATNNFLAGGGDGFDDFKNADQKDNGVLVRDALCEDVKQKKTLNPVDEDRISISKNENLCKVTCIATSDVHGNVYPYDYYTAKNANQGLAKVAGYIKEERKNLQNLILVDNGDTIQGSALASYYANIEKNSKNPMIEAMTKMKYDAWVLGNHEFNYGLNYLNKVISEAKEGGINVLSANTYTEENKNFVEPYVIKEFETKNGALKVGILGLTTKTISSWENAENYKGLHFNDLVDEAKKYVSEIRNKGADIVLVSMHSGEESDTDIIPENQVKAVAQGVDGIDVIIAGHMHKNIAQNTYTTKNGGTVLVTEPGKNGQFVSKIQLFAEKKGDSWILKKKLAETVAMDDKVKEDGEIIELTRDAHQKTVDYLNTVIGESTDEFSGKDQTVKETAIMDLINKVQLEVSGAQLSIAAPLSSTAVIPKGNVTIKDISSVYVYENYLYSIKMTGKQIKDWLEFSARYYKQKSSYDEPAEKDPQLNIPDYNLDQLYGAEYLLDLTQPVGKRIKNLKYNGQLIKDDDTFVVAINNYRYNGGGGFMQAAGLKPGEGAIYDSMKTLGDEGQIRNLLISYIKQQEKITPKVEKYWQIMVKLEQNEIMSEGGVLPKSGGIDANFVLFVGGILLAGGISVLCFGIKYRSVR